MAERDTTPVTVNLTSRRPYRVNDADRDVVWAGPGEAEIPAWVAQAWNVTPVETQDEAQPPTDAPWADYDELTVGEVKELLANLSDADRERVRAYEAANKNRSGVLSALEE